jgi:hypothetical protein
MDNQDIEQWLDSQYLNHPQADSKSVNFDKEFMLAMIEQCFNDLRPQWVSVDNIELNINLIVPALQYEGPDYYKGYHQAREDMLSTLPPSEGG